MGAEPETYYKLLGSQLNGRQSLAEAIVKSGSFKGSQSMAITARDLEESLNPQLILAKNNINSISTSLDYVNNVIMSIVPISKTNNLIFFVLKFLVVFLTIFLSKKFIL